MRISILPGLSAIIICSIQICSSCGGKEPGSRTVITPSQRHTDVTTYGLDKSPLDMVYYPIDYPKLKMSGKVKQPPIARVIYSRPHKDGRVIFGELVKYGAPWRMGANEATEIEFFQPVTIQGKRIPQGRYILYCVPYADKWKIFLNNDLFTWGLKIDRSKDIYDFEMPVTYGKNSLEVLTMMFNSNKEKGMTLMIGWDKVRVSVPMSF